MNLALEVDSLDEVADRIRAFMDVKSPQGFLDKVKMLPMLAEMGKFFPKTVSTGALQGSHQARQFLAAATSPSCSAGRRTRAASSPSPASSLAIPEPASAMSACIACRSTTTRTTGMHWQRQKVGAEHYREALASRERPWRDGVQPMERRRPRPSSADPAVRQRSVDIMARTSGGSVLPKAIAPQARWKLPSPSAPIQPSPSPPSFPRLRTSRST